MRDDLLVIGRKLISEKKDDDDEGRSADVGRQTQNSLIPTRKMKNSNPTSAIKWISKEPATTLSNKESKLMQGHRIVPRVIQKEQETLSKKKIKHR